MNSNCIIDILVPSINKTFEVSINKTSKLRTILNLFSAILISSSSETKSSNVFIDPKGGFIYDLEKSVYELGIKNGSKIIFI